MLITEESRKCGPIAKRHLLEKDRLREEVSRVVEYLAHSATLPCQHHLHPNATIISGVRRNRGFWAWVKANYSDLYQATPRALASLFKEYGISMWVSGDAHFLFPPLDELRATFDARNGAQDWAADPSDWVRAG